ncbi:glutamate receptor 1-like [Penaeus japonicus]|uniref:glutamate receptor 1-like n=1 Tax=Penaeus japonicus TaxID=27405 RepID=UPI001C70EA90|nr:glutamate receptor 1-like [Penaeus japonicus]
MKPPINQALVNQSSDSVPSSWPLRSFLMSWWFTAYIIVLSYTCNLIAFLTIPAYPVKLESVQQLADSHHRVCMMSYGNNTMVAFVDSQTQALSDIAKKMDLVPFIETEPYSNTLECLKHVMAGTHAMLEGESYLANMVQDAGHGDDTYFLKEKIYEGAQTFFFRKNTPWKYKFDDGIARLVKSGCTTKWLDDIVRDLQGSRNEKTSDGQVALKIEHLQGTFFVLALGWGVALGTFLMERRVAGRRTHKDLVQCLSPTR